MGLICSWSVLRGRFAVVRVVGAGELGAGVSVTVRVGGVGAVPGVRGVAAGIVVEMVIEDGDVGVGEACWVLKSCCRRSWRSRRDRNSWAM